jgi:Tfp pilus assembly protein PilP
MHLLKSGVLAAAIVAASVVVLAQTPPAQPAPPNAAPPQPGAGAVPAAAPTPAEAYTYDQNGRRDPFVSLVARGVEPTTTGRRTAGLSGLSAEELSVRGVLLSQGAYIALVSGPDGKTFTARANDRLADGVIRSITPQGLVIMQEVNDPLSLIKQREVRKGLKASDDGKQ